MHPMRHYGDGGDPLAVVATALVLLMRQAPAFSPRAGSGAATP
ncbi:MULTISPECIES: hypothetical protein [Actinomycetes]